MKNSFILLLVLASFNGLGLSYAAPLAYDPAKGCPLTFLDVQKLARRLKDENLSDASLIVQRRIKEIFRLNQGSKWDSGNLHPETYNELFGLLVDLDNRNELVQFLKVMSAEARTKGLLEGVSAEKELIGILQTQYLVQAESIAKGMKLNSPLKKFSSWNEIYHRTTKKILAMKSELSTPAWRAHLEKITSAKWTLSENMEIFFDTAQSFARRYESRARSKQKLYIWSWAFYDDVTGNRAVDDAIAAFKRGEDVRIMVDGNVARQPSHNAPIERLEKAGVPVIRYQSPDNPFRGTHVKIEYHEGGGSPRAWAGGANQGDEYSHLGPSSTPKWAETDIYVEGNSAIESHNLFVKVWNQQVDLQKLSLGKLKSKLALPNSNRGIKTLVIEQIPNDEGVDPILESLIQTIYSSKPSTDGKPVITITNAYFITSVDTNPALREAILWAQSNRRPVQIFTNSIESIDEPTVIAPILASMPDLLAAGVEVYLKKGATVHRKTSVINNVVTVMSENLHPRSTFYEREVAYFFESPEQAALYRQDIQNNLNDYVRVQKPEDLMGGKSVGRAKSFLSDFANRIFINQF